MDYDRPGWGQTAQFERPGAAQFPPPPPRASQPAGGGRNWGGLIASALVAGLVSAAVSGFVAERTIDAAPPAAQQPDSSADEVLRDEPVRQPAAQLEGDGSIADVADAVLPSVAQVNVSGQQGEGNGSAVVYSADGLLVTNNHVVAGASDLEVQLSDGSVEDADVVGTDPLSDLALIRIDAEALPVPDYAQIAPEVGSTAIAIGSPFGLTSTVTAGIVSATGRTIEGDASQPPLVGMLQTDAAINPGNSGGALVDDTGRIIGINTAIYSSTQQNAGIGFAIPVETVRDVAEDLLDDGVVTYAFLGVSSQPITPQVAEQLGLDVTAGAFVADVVNGSPADDAGLRQGDAIIAVDGVALTQTENLFAVLRQYQPGDEVTVTYVREGEQAEVGVTLAERDE